MKGSIKSKGIPKPHELLQYTLLFLKKEKENMVDYALSSKKENIDALCCDISILQVEGVE